MVESFAGEPTWNSRRSLRLRFCRSCETASELLN